MLKNNYSCEKVWETKIKIIHETSFPFKNRHLAHLADLDLVLWDPFILWTFLDGQRFGPPKLFNIHCTIGKIPRI